MASQPIVRVEHLSKVFHRDSAEVTALDDASLEIAAGEFMALMGPSGSGKTTLLNIIAGIDRPSAGHVYVGDTDIAELDEDELAEWRNQHVGFIFQMYNLIPVLTARENVELPLLLTDLGRAERRAHAEAALAPWGWRIGWTTGRGSCPAGRSNGWPSRGRWSPTRCSCWRTSPPAIWTPDRPRRSSRSWAD